MKRLSAFPDNLSSEILHDARGILFEEALAPLALQQAAAPFLVSLSSHTSVNSRRLDNSSHFVRKLFINDCGSTLC